MNPIGRLARQGFRGLRWIAGLVSDDPFLHYRLAAPLARVLSRLPGRWGGYWSEILTYLERPVRTREAVRDFERRLADLGPDSLCIDLGANVGLFTRKLAERAGQVHAFEPDVWSFARLSEAVADLPNVTLHQAAVGTASGKLTFYRPAGFEDDPAFHSVGATAMRTEGRPQTEGYEVDCVDFVAFLTGLDRDVDIVKMDIEGAEIELMQALAASPVRHRIGAIYVETHVNLFPEQIAPLQKLRRSFASGDRPYVNFDWP